LLIVYFGTMIQAHKSLLLIILSEIVFVEYQNFDKKNGNVRIDPLFVSEEQGDYRLSNSSPALGKGVSSIVVGGQTLLSDAADLVKNAQSWSRRNTS